VSSCTKKGVTSGKLSAVGDGAGLHGSEPRESLYPRSGIQPRGGLSHQILYLLIVAATTTVCRTSKFSDPDWLLKTVVYVCDITDETVRSGTVPVHWHEIHRATSALVHEVGEPRSAGAVRGHGRATEALAGGLQRLKSGFPERYGCAHAHSVLVRFVNEKKVG